MVAYLGVLELAGDAVAMVFAYLGVLELTGDAVAMVVAYLGALKLTGDAVAMVVAYLGVLEFAGDAAAVVFDGALSVVIHPAGAAQYVVDARGRLVPRVPVLPPAKRKHKHVFP